MECVLKNYKFKAIEIKEDNQEEILKFLHANKIDYTWVAGNGSFKIFDELQNAFILTETTDFIVCSDEVAEVYCKQEFNEKFTPYQYYV